MCMKGCTQESYTRDSFIIDEQIWWKARRPGWTGGVNIHFAIVKTAGLNHYSEGVIQDLKLNQGLFEEEKTTS